MGDRVVDCARLESVCAERHRGFESPPIRGYGIRQFITKNRIIARLTIGPLILPLALVFTGIAFVSRVSAVPSSAYELGKSKGFEDGVNGLSRTPSRHEVLYSQADRADFFAGYEDGYNAGIKPGAKLQKNYFYGQPLTTVNGHGAVTIMEGKRKVAVCRTSSPNIEETRFINEQQQIVVKSRGNHGPATVELFDSFTGKQKGSVKAYEIHDGKPSWAAGMGE